VPLHAIKKEQRGFNQSEAFGRGLSEGLGVELKIDILKRIKYTETQTKKTRQERIDNVMGVFEVTHPDLIKEKKIILVDDVITTGVTLEIAANELMKYHPKELSILTIACAGGV
jgi:ComF family protein